MVFRPKMVRRAFECDDVRAYSAPVIAKEYDQRWKRWRTTVAIQCNMSAGICPQCFFIYWIATLRSR